MPQLLSSNGTELIVYILGLVTENKAKSKFFRNFLLQWGHAIDRENKFSNWCGVGWLKKLSQTRLLVEFFLSLWNVHKPKSRLYHKGIPSY